MGLDFDLAYWSCFWSLELVFKGLLFAMSGLKWSDTKISLLPKFNLITFLIN